MTRRALPITERLIDIDPARDTPKLVTNYADPWGFPRQPAPPPQPAVARLVRALRGVFSQTASKRN